MRPARLALAALATLALTAAASADPIRYAITPLGTLGGNQSFALDLNDAGWVTGNSSTQPGSNLPLSAFVWRNGVMTNLGVLPASNNFSRGYAVNNGGVVVGESGNNIPRAFAWRNGVMTDLGTLGGASAVAHDVNSAGHVVGASSNGLASRPFITVNGVMTDLGTLAGGANTSGRAWAVNDRGEAAGLSAAPGTPSQATLWRPDGAGGYTPTDLNSLGNGLQFSQAFGLDNTGRVVGVSILAGSTERAFLWENGAMADLGTLTGLAHSRANDVNDRGQVVGHASQFAGFPTINGRALLWEGGTLYDLNTLVPPGSGWVLQSAEAINAGGQIVGYGSFNGQTRAFLLTPVAAAAVPEPATVAAWLLVAGALLFAAGRPRARSA